MKQRILAVLLILCMVLSLLPMTVLADDTKSGTCGENLTWTLVDGVLTISGKGDMRNFNLANDSNLAPWYWNRNSITTVKIEDGVTTIGNFAFYQCTNLRDVTIPDSVTYISINSFKDSGYFNNDQNWENGVLYLDKWILYANQDDVSGECIIKEGTVGIAAYAFEKCNNLSGVSMPDSLTNIGAYAFQDCTALSNVKLGKRITCINGFYGCTSLNSITLPDGVTSIEGDAFAGCAGLTSINFPDSITNIGGQAFMGCNSLTDITLPDSLTSIGEFAFSGCDSLHSITIPVGVINIGTSAFGSNPDFAVYGYSGSFAETYAKENQFAFIDLKTEQPNTPIEPDKPSTPDDPTDSIITFIDVQDTPTTHWYYAPVLWAVEKGVTNGISDTEFAPNNTCTRAQAVAFLWRAAGRPEPSSTANPFVDVVDTADTNWYYKAVLWAVEKGITTGTDATHFSPEGEVSRGQMVTFLWRMHEKPTAEGSTFADVPANEYYYNAVSWAVSQGITNGTDAAANTFEPLTTCSRAHIVTFLYRDQVK